MRSSRSLPKEVSLWLAAGSFGLGLFERVLVLLDSTRWVQLVVVKWQGVLWAASGALIAWLHARFGLVSSRGFVPFIPLLLELAVVVALGFVNFGFEPYWTRARRSRPGSPLLPRYLINLLACLILIGFMLFSVSGGEFAGHGWHGAIEGIRAGAQIVLHPVERLDFCVLGALALLLALLMFWHPGTAIRVLIIVAALWAMAEFSALVAAFDSARGITA